MGKARGVVDRFSLTGAGKPLSNFYCQSCTPETESDNEIVRDEVGEYDPSTNHSFNDTDKIEAEYECKLKTLQSDIVFTVGVEAEPLEITQIVITLRNNKYARIRVVGHEHPDTNFDTHLDSERTITLPDFLGFGSSDFLGVFTLLDVQSSTYTITLGHDDDQNNVGEHLVGSSYGEMHEATVEAITDTVPPDPALPWKRTRRSSPTTNTGQYRNTMTAWKAIAGPA